MENFMEQAVGYFVMENDIPDIGLRAGDCVFIDDDQNADTRLIVAEWDGEAHICTFTNHGEIFDYGYHNLAPDNAEVIGRALYVVRKICLEKDGVE